MIEHIMRRMTKRGTHINESVYNATVSTYQKEGSKSRDKRPRNKGLQR